MWNIKFLLFFVLIQVPLTIANDTEVIAYQDRILYR